MTWHGIRAWVHFLAYGKYTIFDITETIVYISFHRPFKPLIVVESVFRYLVVKQIMLIASFSILEMMSSTVTYPFGVTWVKHI